MPELTVRTGFRMLAASIILVVSAALLFFYLQAICEKILSTRFEREYSQVIAEANRLEFPTVRKVVEEFDASVDYSWVRKALNCDFLILAYLMENGPNAQRGSDRRLLMLYFHAIFFCLSALRPLKALHKLAILKLTAILQHFANVIGERAALGLGDLDASHDLLTL